MELTQENYRSAAQFWTVIGADGVEMIFVRVGPGMIFAAKCFLFVVWNQAVPTVAWAAKIIAVLTRYAGFSPDAGAWFSGLLFGDPTSVLANDSVQKTPIRADFMRGGGGAS